MSPLVADPRFGPRTLAATAEGGRELGRLLADLELWLLEALRREGDAGLGRAVAALDTLGHALAPVADSDPPEWSGPLPDGRRRLVLSGAATPASEWVSASLEPIDAPDPPEPDPRHTAFYARWETLIGLDDAAVAALAPADRMVHHLATLEGEVHNGGFLQYLDNTGGRWLDETVAMLETLEAHSALAQLREVQAHLEGARPDDMDGWNAALERLEATGELDSLDDRFYALDDDLAAAAAEHLRLR